MVVSGAGVGRESMPADRETAQPPAAVVWHDLECGGYRVDLPVWLALAARVDGPILDVGAGTGRVTLALARAGHAVTAVDREPALLDALRERAAGLPVETVRADARTLALGRDDYALCLMPMQTIQLLEGAAGRIAFLRRAREHLRPGGIVACAILGELEPFDCSDRRIGPAAERVRVGELEYVSRAIRLAESRTTVTIERERRIRHLADAEPAIADGGSSVADGGASAPPEPRRERDAIELDRLSASRLERDGSAAGLHAEPRIEIPATDEHVGSTVVVLRA